MYVLNLAEDNRVLSVCNKLDGVDYNDVPIADKRPEDVYPGCNTEDCYYINGEYIYDPKPEDPKPDPSVTEPTEYVSYEEIANAIREGVNSYNG